MRREFIFILLGIIFVSTLSSLLAGYTQADPEKVLLDTVVGAVGAGNFSYWQLGHTGPLLVELNSLTGDADLYVADNIRYVCIFMFSNLTHRQSRSRFMFKAVSCSYIKLRNLVYQPSI